MHTHRLVFDDKDLHKLITHMKHNVRRIPYTNTKTEEYGLWLVKDEGIYLMSPTDIRYDRVFYAHGFNPQVDNGDDTLWDKTCSISPDDFVEFVPLDENMMNRVMDTNKIIIYLNEEELRIVV